MTCVRCGGPDSSQYMCELAGKLCIRCIVLELLWLRKLNGVRWKNIGLGAIPEGSVHITVEQFTFMCDTGFLDSFDGHGFMATADEMSDVPAVPKATINPAFSHVVWFHNKVKVSKKTSKEILGSAFNVETLNKDSIN